MAMAKGIQADACSMDAVVESNLDLDSYDLIGLGSGVYRESLSPKLYRAVEGWNWQDRKVFVFSTSGVGLKFYNRPLVKLLHANGAKVLGSFACKGYFVAKDFTEKKIFDWMGKRAHGHPNGDDLRKAEEFAISLMG